jgi:hypothetical protein
MKRYLIITIISFAAALNIHAQKTNQFTVSVKGDYKVISDSKFPVEIELPKDEQGKEMSWEDIVPQFNRISMITDSIFCDEEILKLKENRIIVSFLISSNGKISYVRFRIRALDAKIDLDKIEILAEALKKEIKFELKFPRPIKTEGSVLYSIDLYRIIPYIPNRVKGYER